MYPIGHCCQASKFKTPRSSNPLLDTLSDMESTVSIKNTFSGSSVPRATSRSSCHKRTSLSDMDWTKSGLKEAGASPSPHDITIVYPQQRLPGKRTPHRSGDKQICREHFAEFVRNVDKLNLVSIKPRPALPLLLPDRKSDEYSNKDKRRRMGSMKHKRDDQLTPQSQSDVPSKSINCPLKADQLSPRSRSGVPSTCELLSTPVPSIHYILGYSYDLQVLRLDSNLCQSVLGNLWRTETGILLTKWLRLRYATADWTPVMTNSSSSRVRWRSVSEDSLDPKMYRMTSKCSYLLSKYSMSWGRCHRFSITNSSSLIQIV
uniref:Uncharacterized protein n=1 Tax=Timema poppense TaxID=170557 RepID=A0A7R9D608_TIMPO|nr:unnamed protein product [Timema poppensis]